MNPPNYIHVDEPVTPIEADATPPKEKRYQFRSTVRAWRSKYKRHIGTKQLQKEFLRENKSLTDDQLKRAYVHMHSEHAPDFPTVEDKALVTLSYYTSLVARGFNPAEVLKTTPLFSEDETHP